MVIVTLILDAERMMLAVVGLPAESKHTMKNISICLGEAYDLVSLMLVPFAEKMPGAKVPLVFFDPDNLTKARKMQQNNFG